MDGESGRGMNAAELATVIQRDISRGAYGIGQALPSEAELKSRFGVGRHTVREAVRRLVDSGLVERRQGAPTRVVALQPRASYVHSLLSLGELIHYTQETQLEIAENAVVPLDEADAALVGAAPRSRWLRLLGLRREVASEEVISHATVLLHARFAPLFAHVSKPKGPVYAVVEAATGEVVMEARQEISVGPLPLPAAKVLGLAPGVTAIMITRRYIDISGSIMFASRNWHKAENFRYAVSLRRDTPP
ncbi:GntR family transcriptional regulator [Aquabacter sp. L1I39]|uniref:GntR family transcriptional regulator n=1 Tax=Aquabacter sp. L1I39 TaxID=2820278 RepID=UPI001ADA8E35|nr:GntR family transcriptional regulator [Aquabacter sp. L1I39]QTL04699.1 GntR family transcriptional regulator [Aquabacter sp. L1I39]